MKESFEDKMTNKIREVTEDYNPDYSPQAWEKLRMQIPPKESWLNRLILKYRFWLSGAGIMGVLVIAYHAAVSTSSQEVSEMSPQSPEPISYFEIRIPGKITYFGNRDIVNPMNSKTDFHDNQGYSTPDSKDNMSDNSSDTAYQNLNQIEYPVTEIPEKTAIKSATTLAVYKSDFRQNMFPALKKIEFTKKDLTLTPDAGSDGTKKLKLHLPEFNLSSADKSYNKFVGPNRVSAFYSPEMHIDKELKNLGISQGFGLAVEGPIRTLMTISAGLSYQKNNYEKTVFSAKVPPHNLTQPLDSIDYSQYIDSTVISSGHYAFLELPVLINFRIFESSKSELWVSAGFSSIAFLEQSYTLETIVGGISSKTTTSTKAWEEIKVLGSINAGSSFRYKLNDRFSLQSSILYKQHLGSFGSNSLKINRINLQIGLIYRFGRQ